MAPRLVAGSISDSEFVHHMALMEETTYRIEEQNKYREGHLCIGLMGRK
jgi:hypothetical protein